MPALVIPYASPVTAVQPSPASQQQARTNSQPTGVQPVVNPAIVVASPAPLDLGSTLIFASSSPTPQLTPTGTRTATDGDDVVASGPPRRLITSFEALRQTGGGGETTQ